MQGFFSAHKSINVAYHINTLKNKNHMMISIDAEKAFNKIQHPFMIKTLHKVGIEDAYLKMIKDICDKPTARIMLNGENLKDHESFKIRNKTRMSTLTTFIQHRFRSPSLNTQRRKRSKGNPYWKEVKLSLFADDMMLYIDNPKVATRKLLEHINEFGKVVSYKSNTQKSVAFLYTHNERLEREIQEIQMVNLMHLALHQK